MRPGQGRSGGAVRYTTPTLPVWKDSEVPVQSRTLLSGHSRKSDTEIDSPEVEGLGDRKVDLSPLLRP